MYLFKKQIVFLLLFLLHIQLAWAQSDVKLLTLSNGKYNELYAGDSLRQVGSAVINIKTGTISVFSGASRNNQESGRWLSTDPLQAKYSGLSPYCFVGNMPISSIDPDGRDIIVDVSATTTSTFGHAKLLVTNYEKVKVKIKGEWVDRYVAVGYREIGYHNTGIDYEYKSKNEIEDGHAQVTVKTSAADGKGGTWKDKKGIHTDYNTEYFTEDEIKAELALLDYGKNNEGKKGDEFDIYANNCSDFVVKCLQMEDVKIVPSGDDSFGHTDTGYDDEKAANPGQVFVDLTQNKKYKVAYGKDTNKSYLSQGTINKVVKARADKQHGTDDNDD